MSRLVVHTALPFGRLRNLTQLTAGNLATHLEGLERVGYVASRDAIVGKRPSRLVALTPGGRLAFERYLRDLEALLGQLRRLQPADSNASPELAALFQLGAAAPEGDRGAPAHSSGDATQKMT